MSIMLLKMSSLTPSLMIIVAVSTAMRFSLLFCSHIAGGTGLGTVSMRSYTSFSTSMALVRSDHRGQLLKPVSFSRRELLEEELSLSSVIFIGG